MGEATVTLLREMAEAGAEEHAAPVVFPAQVIRVAEPNMELVAAEPCASGAALKIETEQAVWLGEVVECAREEGGYAIAVRLRHVLRDFETLARLAERFGTKAPAGALKRGAH